MLHITDGESVAGTLRESAIPGVVSVYGDMMYEGPAPAGLESEKWLDTRTRFMVDADYASAEEARQYLKDCEDALAAFSQHEEVLIWLDPRLSDQLILIKVLDWFSRRDLHGVKLSLISIERYPGIDRFVGLGQLTASQLEQLVDKRVPIGEAQFRTAQTAWNAFTSPDPTEIERFIASDTSALPFVASALRRHLEQFPSVDNGLSRTERQALSVLKQRGPIPRAQLFVAVACLEEKVFMGDSSFFRLLEELCEARHPLLAIADDHIEITETGRKVLEGRADHVRLNGIDRWLGGVHLKDDGGVWRWDGAGLLRQGKHPDHSGSKRDVRLR
jgi:hypothetical protein